MEDNEIFNFGDDNQVIDNNVDDESFVFGQSDGDSDTTPNDDGDSVQYDDDGNPIETSYIDELLKSRGIDRNSIEITEEDGTVSTVKFDDLSDEDKLTLLRDDVPEEDEYPEITDSDLQILNYFKANRINSLQEFADGVAQQAVANYIASQQGAPKSDIDGYSDDEVIAYDMIQKFGEDMADEEIDAEIERLKEDENAYKKRVDLLRTYYKNEEEAQRKLYEDDQAAQRQADTVAFQQAYGQAAYGLNTIQGIDLEDADKQDLLDYVLQKDQFGKTEFSKALDNPEAVLKMAWFLKYGEDAAEATRNYFAHQIAQARAAAKPAAKPQTRAVSRPSKPASTTQSKQTNSFKF